MICHDLRFTFHLVVSFCSGRLWQEVGAAAGPEALKLRGQSNAHMTPPYSNTAGAAKRDPKHSSAPSGSVHGMRQPHTAQGSILQLGANCPAVLSGSGSSVERVVAERSSLMMSAEVQGVKDGGQGLAQQGQHRRQGSQGWVAPAAAAAAAAAAGNGAPSKSSGLGASATHGVPVLGSNGASLYGSNGASLYGSNGTSVYGSNGTSAYGSSGTKVSSTGSMGSAGSNISAGGDRSRSGLPKDWARLKRDRGLRVSGWTLPGSWLAPG